MNEITKEYKENIQKELSYIEYRKEILVYILNHDTVKVANTTKHSYLKEDLFRDSYKEGIPVDNVLEHINESLRVWVNREIQEYQENIREELFYLEYKKRLLIYILNHDAIETGEPTVLFPLEDKYWRDLYKAKTPIQNVIEDIEETFNKWGW